MSLSAWEQRVLDSIKDELAGSDSELARLLSAFNLLASGQKMPARHNVWVSPRRARDRRRGAHRLLCSQRTVLALWLLTTATLIAVVLTLNLAGGTHSTCAATVAVLSCGSMSGRDSPAPARNADTGRSSGQVVTIPQTGP